MNKREREREKKKEERTKREKKERKGVETSVKCVTCKEFELEWKEISFRTHFLFRTFPLSFFFFLSFFLFFHSFSLLFLSFFSLSLSKRRKRYCFLLKMCFFFSQIFLYHFKSYFLFFFPSFVFLVSFFSLSLSLSILLFFPLFSLFNKSKSEEKRK